MLDRREAKCYTAYRQVNTKAMTKTDLTALSYREPGRVEARRAASGNPITSELKFPKRRE